MVASLLSASQDVNTLIALMESLSAIDLALPRTFFSALHVPNEAMASMLLNAVPWLRDLDVGQDGDARAVRGRVLLLSLTYSGSASELSARACCAGMALVPEAASVDIGVVGPDGSALLGNVGPIVRSSHTVAVDKRRRTRRLWTAQSFLLRGRESDRELAAHHFLASASDLVRTYLVPYVCADATIDAVGEARIRELAQWLQIIPTPVRESGLSEATLDYTPWTTRSLVNAMAHMCLCAVDGGPIRYIAGVLLRTAVPLAAAVKDRGRWSLIDEDLTDLILPTSRMLSAALDVAGARGSDRNLSFPQCGTSATLEAAAADAKSMSEHRFRVRLADLTRGLKARGLKGDVVRRPNDATENQTWPGAELDFWPRDEVDLLIDLEVIGDWEDAVETARELCTDFLEAGRLCVAYPRRAGQIVREIARRVSGASRLSEYELISTRTPPSGATLLERRHSERLQQFVYLVIELSGARNATPTDTYSPQESSDIERAIAEASSIATELSTALGPVSNFVAAVLQDITVRFISEATASSTRAETTLAHQIIQSMTGVNEDLLNRRASDSSKIWWSRLK